MSSQSSHHPQEVLLAQFSLYVHKGGLKPDSFHFFGEVVICSLEDCQGEAVMYCRACQEYLCQACTGEHAAHRLTRKHQTIALVEAKGQVTPSTQSYHPCGRHPDQMLDMYCKACEEIICFECCKTEHIDHLFTTLRPFVKPCVERLNVLLKRIDKLLTCVDLARQTSQQHLDKAQHHIVSLKKQVTSTFTQMRKKLSQQEERLMSDLETAATRLDKIASTNQGEHQLAEVNLESLRFLGQSLLTGDVYDQINNLPSLEQTVEKRWRTRIPGVAWLGLSEKKVNLSNAGHLTLTETSHATSVLPCLTKNADSETMSSLEANTAIDNPLQSAREVMPLTGAASNMFDQGAVECREDGELSRIVVGGKVGGLCVYSGIICLVKLYESSLYMYSSNGNLIKKHVLNGVDGTRGLVLMRLEDNDKLVISARDPYSLCHLPIRDEGDKCEIGNTQLQKLNYEPRTLHVDQANCLVVTDQSNGSLHVYNTSCNEVTIVKLPSAFAPWYVSSNPCGYFVTDYNSNQIIWTDKQGTQQRRFSGTAFGLKMSGVRGVVRDAESRQLVADCDDNQLLLFNKNGGGVRSPLKDSITQPLSLYLDHDKLYVGQYNGQVVVYDYYVLLGEYNSIKYNMTQLDIKSISQV